MLDEVRATMAVARESSGAVPNEVLAVGGAGVLFVLGLGLRYLRRLVLEDDDRQREVRAELGALRHEALELRSALYAVKQDYAICHSDRARLEADIESLRDEVRELRG